MPFLGYTMLLPPGFERVTGDTSAPVPSSASIVDRDPQTGQALSAAAQRIHDNGGLFDGMGLWSIDPSSLLQLGVLAGEPYRVGAGDLQGIVEQAVVERASDLERPGRPGHQRPGRQRLPRRLPGCAPTSPSIASSISGRPTGRYLDPGHELPGHRRHVARGDGARHRRLAPAHHGSAADLPDPGTPTTGPADAALEATLPDHIAGVPLTRRSLAGESLVSSTDTVTGSIAGELGRVVPAPGDVTLALAVPTDGAAPLLIAGYRLAGVSVMDAQAFIDSFPADVWSDARVAGHDVRVSVVGDGGARTWLHVASGPDGDSVLYQVDSSKPALGLAAVAALP